MTGRGKIFFLSCWCGHPSVRHGVVGSEENGYEDMGSIVCDGPASDVPVVVFREI